jgi:hypothetical protein
MNNLIPSDTNSLVSYHLAGGNYRQGKFLICYALPCGMRFRSLANFVGCVVGFLNVLNIRLRSLLLAQLKQDSSTNELLFTA